MCVIEQAIKDSACVFHAFRTLRQPFQVSEVVVGAHVPVVDLQYLAEQSATGGCTAFKTGVRGQPWVQLCTNVNTLTSETSLREAQCEIKT